MKTTLILILFLVISPCISQQSLYLISNIGQSKHFNYGTSNIMNREGTFIPVLSGGASASIEISKFSLIRPYAGLGVSFLGTIYKIHDHPAIDPGRIFRFRHIYLTLPAGLNIPIHKSGGLDLALINGWRLNDRSSEIIGNPRIWDVAVQPGVYVNIEQWRLGVSYYYGIRDIFGLGRIDVHNDLKYYNHAMHFNVAYKLKSFDKN